MWCYYVSFYRKFSLALNRVLILYKKLNEVHLLMLQVIPRQLCDNAGFDATDVLNKLRQKHALPSGGSLFSFIEIALSNCHA